MKHRAFIGLIGLLILFYASGEAAAQNDRPNFQALPRELRELVDTWLGRDCGTSEGRKSETRLGETGARLEPVFWEAYRLGPHPEDLERIRKTMAIRFGERQEWLRKSGEGRLGSDASRRLLFVPEAQYVEREIDRYVMRYKNAAIMGIAIAGTKASVAELKRIAVDERNPARAVAGRALDLIRQRRPE